jgi:hypothetical protein
VFFPAYLKKVSRSLTSIKNQVAYTVLINFTIYSIYIILKELKKFSHFILKKPKKEKNYLIKIDSNYLKYSVFNYIVIITLKCIVKDFLDTLKINKKIASIKKSPILEVYKSEDYLIKNINKLTGDSYNLVNLIRFNEGRRELSIYTYIRYIIYSGYIY